MGFTLHLLLSSTNFYCLLPLLRIRSNREMKLYAAVYRTDMFCNEKYFSKIIFTWCDPVVAFIFHCMLKGFKSMKNNSSKLQQVFNWWELYICLLLQIKLYLEGKGAFGRRIKKKRLKTINYINDSQLGDGFSARSAVSNTALFGDAFPYHPDSKLRKGFWFLMICYCIFV